MPETNKQKFVKHCLRDVEAQKILYDAMPYLLDYMKGAIRDSKDEYPEAYGDVIHAINEMEIDLETICAVFYDNNISSNQKIKNQSSVTRPALNRLKKLGHYQEEQAQG